MQLVIVIVNVMFTVHRRFINLRYDTTAEFNADSKAECDQLNARVAPAVSVYLNLYVQRLSRVSTASLQTLVHSVYS